MLHIHCSFSFREKRPKLTYTKISPIYGTLQFKFQRASGEISISLLTELPSLNKEFISIIIIKGDNHSTV